MIKPLEVIWIHDELIKPPGPKMVVCVEPEIGLYLRINSDGWRDGSLKIEKGAHKFLDHDSYIECGDPFDLDDYIVLEALKKSGVIGNVDSALAEQICEAVRNCSLIARADKNAICTALGCQ